MKNIIVSLILCTTFSAYAISKKDKEICQNYQKLVQVIIEKSDSGIDRKQLKQAMSSNPEIFPIRTYAIPIETDGLRNSWRK